MSRSNSMERGFVTMATGDISYFEVARNLLLSYRWFSRDPLPFAIICDRENEITAMFDRVVMIDRPVHSFLDKLRVPGLVPFDENIFIDSDCLAYRDLNGLWKLFSGSADFSVLGVAFPFRKGFGWFRREDTGIFRDRVKFSMLYQGGLFFCRKGKLGEFSGTCRYILDNYGSFKFAGYPYSDPVDETVFALASSVHGFRPAESYENVFCYYPLCHGIKADIGRGRLSYRYRSTWIYPHGRYFLHWSMAEVKGEAYRSEVARLKAMVDAGARPRRSWEARNRSVDFMLNLLIRIRTAVAGILPYGFKASVHRLLHPWKQSVSNE